MTSWGTVSFLRRILLHGVNLISRLLFWVIARFPGLETCWWWCLWLICRTVTDEYGLSVAEETEVLGSEPALMPLFCLDYLVIETAPSPGATDDCSWYRLSLWHTVFRKLEIAQFLRRSPPCIEPEVSLPYSQEPFTGPYSHWTNPVCILPSCYFPF